MNRDQNKVRKWAIKISKERELQVEKTVYTKHLMWKYVLLGVCKDSQGLDWNEQEEIIGEEIKDGEKSQVIMNLVDHKQALHNLLGEI